MVPNGMPLAGKFCDSFVVMMDGKLLGRVNEEDASELIQKLRFLKSTGKEKVTNIVMFIFLPVLV